MGDADDADDADDGRRVEKSIAAYEASTFTLTRHNYDSFIDEFYAAVGETCTVAILRFPNLTMHDQEAALFGRAVATLVSEWETQTRDRFVRFKHTYNLGWSTSADDTAKLQTVRSLGQRIRSVLAILSRQLRKLSDESYVGQEEVTEFLSEALRFNFSRRPMLSWLDVRFSPAKVDIGGSFSDLCAIPDGPRPPTR